MLFPVHPVFIGVPCKFHAYNVYNPSIVVNHQALFLALDSYSGDIALNSTAPKGTHYVKDAGRAFRPAVYIRGT
jgi:hypothetical protein